ncbi:MAG: FkbM family methyltransferase [Oscillatoriaceae cyanobacterium Prado104]|jgi:FkbM family methyltransferase|nr:FkbM family methyltransferase [Oscillatoriaceae cyanobacterium Prado104]
MKSTKLVYAILPYIRWELPGWGKLFENLGGYQKDLWKNAPTRTIRGKFHQYLMTLDLSFWHERVTYFLGRYYELEMQLFVMEIVKPGDTFVDIGANLGMLTLMAARCVTETGTVHSFEPNPLIFKRLQKNITDNELQQVTLHNCGLGDRQTELTLTIVNEEFDMGTFTEIPEQDRSLITSQYQLPVYRGDDILPEELPGTTFIKIDVEGFEPLVIRGLDRTIKRWHPVFLIEVVPEYLERGGSSPEELRELMESYGYQPVNIFTKRSGLRHQLKLTKIAGDRMTDSLNVLWLHRDNHLASHLAKYF